MGTEQTINLNQNAADCIKAIMGLGSTTYQNICSGASAVVPWGIGDWALAIFITVALVAMISVFGGLAILIIRDA